MLNIQRIGATTRWSDIVVYNGVARWVEVAEQVTEDFAGEVAQVLSQMDHRLQSIGSDRTQVLQVLILISDLALVPELNRQWDVWFPLGHAPVRACVEAGLQSNYKIELVIEAAVPG